MAKVKQRFSWTYNHEMGTATCKDNATDNEVEFSLFDLPDVIQAETAAYGLGKVLQDRRSGTDADEKLAAYGVTYEDLLKGNWKSARTGGERLLPPVIEAIVLRKGCSTSQAQKAYKVLDDAGKLALKEALADDIATILEARKEAEDVTLDDLMKPKD